MRRAQLLVTLLAALACEGLAWVLLGAGAWAPALAMHVAAAGLAADRSYARTGARAAFAAAWFWAGLFPGFGLAAVLLLERRWGRRGRFVPGVSWEERRRRAATEVIAERRQSQAVTADALPLVDALGHPDADVRLLAVDALRDQHTERAVRLLARERDSEIYDVRLRAVESLGKLSSHRLRELAQAAAAVEGGDGSFEAHARLARSCMELVELGQDHDGQGGAYLQRAIVHAELALQLRFDAPLELLLARAYTRAGALDCAETELRRAVASAPDRSEALLALAEHQLQRNEFTELRTLCTRLRDDVDADTRLRNALEFWSREVTRVEQVPCAK